ncbi:MAG: sensor histidine kinase N-terminal domain-containing protein [Marinosulfonomonas sp.]|nr:sensor histidine kinase N-terminal domain-containing protein [Marinosulfonomonas sp.]
MRFPRSLQGRLALAIGLGVALVWIITALITAATIRHEMDEVFDSALEETAQRILPLAVQELFETEDDGTEQLITTLREHDEFLTYVVRDRNGRILLRSHDADIRDFPPFQKTGFTQTGTHILYFDAALDGDFTIAIAEPLTHRNKAARETLMALGVPLFFLLPITLGGIWLLLRFMLGPLRGFREEVAARGGRDLTPVDAGRLPTEIKPVAEAVNALLGRLQRTLDAERSFAANAAHELRTPVAAALAQVQRLQVETAEEGIRKRASDVEASLKRLNRLSEKLMQMARAEGANLRVDTPHDLVQILKMVADDLTQADHDDRLDLKLPDQPVMSRIDPDAFAIAARNLMENALRHGDASAPVSAELCANGTLKVINGGPVVPPKVLQTLTQRFSRLDRGIEGSGLGLAIVQVIADGTGGKLELHSPAIGRVDGFEVVLSPAHSLDWTPC